MDTFNPLKLNLFLFCIINVILLSSSQNHNIPCLIDPDVDKIRENCILKACIWEKGGCYLNSNTYGYTLADPEVDLEENEFILKRNEITSNTTYFGGDFPYIRITFSHEDETRLRIKIQNRIQNSEYNRLKNIFDEKVLAYESPLEAVPSKGNELYKVEITNSPVFSFKVMRKSSSVTIFDTALGGLTLSEQFMQLSVKLPSTNVYGFGEFEQTSLKLNFANGTVYSMYSLDHTPAVGFNLFGVQPIYTVLEDSIGQVNKTGDLHTVIFLNSHAQEFELLNTPGYVYRSIGGYIDILITLGPTPVDNSKQLSKILGKPAVPPYFSLGFHLNQQIYSGGLTELIETVTRTQNAEIPLDVIYADVGTMDKYLSFTINPDYKDFPAYVNELKSQGIRLVIVVNSPYGQENGNNLDEFWIKGENGESLVGHNDIGHKVNFPDFFNPLTQEWWNQTLQKFAQEISFDGVLITENEPSNMDLLDPMICNYSSINNPPYVPAIKERNMSLHSICPSSVHNTGGGQLLHYNVHNLYGLMSTDATYQALRYTFPEKRKLLISRSTFLGSGRRGGHWLAENTAHREDMKLSIIGMLQFNLWGIPFSGQDICGYRADSSDSLCSRWTQLGAFYPYSRNNNGQNNRPQDPASWQKVTESAKNALSIRYTLLPYMYSVFFEGLPVVRPTWYEFPTDPLTYEQDEQFLFGAGILISPDLTAEQADKVKVYFPQPCRWYDYNNNGLQVQIDDIDKTTILPAPLYSINVHVRGGQIIPTQIPDVNTMKSRQNNFGLIVALDEEYEAQGLLYYDDGESFDTEASGAYYFAKFTYESSGLLKSSIEHNGISNLMDNKFLTSIRLMGCKPLDSLKVNGENHDKFHQFSNGSEAYITALLIDMNSNFTIEFTYDEDITFPTTVPPTEPSTTSKPIDPPIPSSTTESNSDNSTSLSSTSPDITTTQAGGGSELLKINSFNLLILLICILLV